MKENTLLKISLVSGFIGITLLLFISRTIHPPEEDVSLMFSSSDDRVVISGNVINIMEYENSANVVIARTEFIQVVVFDKENLDFLGLSDGDKIEAMGKVESNKGKKQLIAEEIRVV